ncbi:MAG TPA: rRNA maturation RNase YbeY [Burkholderiales bacterium]|nr:rRNA maturation RNase YbeY [Burkholderiales bacterium]
MGSQSPSPRLSLTTQFAVAARGRPGRRQLRKWAQAALEHDAEVTLRLVGRAEGRRLNRDFRGKDYATNVLTFVYPEARPLAGDIVLCAPVVEDEARAQGKPRDAHYAHLVVHGMLHLQGYDHERSRAARAMEARETEIVTRLGYADPYADDGPSP